MIYGEDPEIKVLEGQNKVLSAMYDEEKRDTTLLTKTKEKEICEVGISLLKYRQHKLKLKTLRMFLRSISN